MMKVAILTSGRFHVLDLARELHDAGHEVSFYSLLPRSRTRAYGLPDHCSKWLGPYLAPVFAAQQLLRRTRFATTMDFALAEAIDRVGARLIRRCDAFIGMSGMSLRSLEAVKRRYRATTFLERGSMHIEAQQRILDARPRELPDRPEIDPRMVAREVAEYARADFISVPSAHVVASFADHGVPSAKLFRNAYGVSLEDFPATRQPPVSPPRILFVGNWSWQKGVDTLTASFENLRADVPDLELHHVGAIGNMPLPVTKGFHHHAPVPQRELTRFYADAHVFVLPSRQDGFGMVLGQALASGVPLVASERTGGADLRAWLHASEAVSVVPPDDVDALTAALATQLDEALRRAHASPGAPRDLLGVTGREHLSWKAYGRRWDERLLAVRR